MCVCVCVCVCTRAFDSLSLCVPDVSMSDADTRTLCTMCVRTYVSGNVLRWALCTEIPLTAFPVVDHKILDLYQLFLGVERSGGVQAVTEHKRWRHIAIHYCRISRKFTSASHAVKKWYITLLADFVDDLHCNHRQLYVQFLRLDKQHQCSGRLCAFGCSR
jgi:ARID/BRIGHT DNA binding domain